MSPSDLTIGQFLSVVRKRINLSAEESIFFFIDDSVIAPTSQSLGTAYLEHKNEDGFLYITYCTENTFG